MSMRLDQLLQGLCEAAPALPVSGVALDSRRVVPGDLFLAVRGVGGQHGLAHVEQALERGAVAVAWEPAPGVTVPQLPVPDVAVADLARLVGEIAARFHGRPADRQFTVGVTGTDGKTSTAWLVAQALERLGRSCFYLGTLGIGRPGALVPGNHTTPDPVSLQAALAEAEGAGIHAAAMEVSSHALDQARVSGMRFDVAILTNLTRDHLDYHGTEAAYAEAKRQLFSRYCRGLVVLNRDDAIGRTWASQFSDVLVYGVEGAVPQGQDYLLARQVELTARGLRFELLSPEGQYSVQSGLLGGFNVYNLLAAAAALRGAAVPMAQVVELLSAAETVPGRMEGFRAEGAPLVVVDYAHTPAALAAALRAARGHARGRLQVVFGCGGDRDRGKRPLMGLAAAQAADRVILTDDNPRSEAPGAIVDEIRAGMGDVTVSVIHDRAEAIRTAIRDAGPDDVVLVAGKGHETTQTLGSTVRPFSDRLEVMRALGLPGGDDAAA